MTEPLDMLVGNIWNLLRIVFQFRQHERIRKPAFGGHIVSKRRRGNVTNGLYEYKLGF